MYSMICRGLGGGGDLCILRPNDLLGQKEKDLIRVSVAGSQGRERRRSPQDSAQTAGAGREEVGGGERCLNLQMVATVALPHRRGDA